MLSYGKYEHFTKLGRISLKYGPDSDYARVKIRKAVGQIGND